MTALLIVHLACIFTLLGVTFYAFGAAPETKKPVMIISGLAAVGVLLTGGAMLGMAHMGFPGWAIVKLVCWLGIASMGGMAYRRRSQAVPFMVVVLALAVVAAAMVILKPF